MHQIMLFSNELHFSCKKTFLKGYILWEGRDEKIFLCELVWEYIDVYSTPCVDVVWLEPPAFQEELVISPTFHNLTYPILHTMVIKDIFAWVYLVSIEQLTNRVNLEMIGIGWNSSEMDRDRYSGNCLFKVEAQWGRRKRNRKWFFVEGEPQTARSTWDTLRDDEPPALLSMTCMLREALKTNEKLRLVTSEFLIPPPPPTHTHTHTLHGDMINVWPLSLPFLVEMKCKGKRLRAVLLVSRWWLLWNSNVVGSGKIMGVEVADMELLLYRVNYMYTDLAKIIWEWVGNHWKLSCCWIFLALFLLH